MKWIEETIESALNDANPVTKLMIKDAYNDRRKIFYTIVVMLLFMILSSSFTSKLFCYIKLDVLMLQLETNHNLAIALIIIYAVFVAYKVIYIRLFVKDLLPTISSIFRLVAALLLYFYFLKFQFEPFAHFKIAFLYGSDVLIILSSIFLLDFRPFKQLPIQIVGQGFYNDFFDINSDNDLFQREHIAKQIANSIAETFPRKSFAIGIIGEWGYGKTTFVDFIFKELKVNKDNILIHFHPWKPNDKPQIIREFYSQLINVVEKIDSKLGRSIGLYADRLVGNDSSQIALFKNVISNLRGNSDTIDFYFEEIKRSIENSGKKFIIYIDDLDRLSGTEILEILKIIRGTAEFPNFFFISGYDLTYLREVMEKSNQIAIEHDYLRKIFQLEFILPPISYDMLMETLEKKLKNDFMLSKYKEEILTTFKSLKPDPIFFDRDKKDEFVERDNLLIKNHRDTTRILNSLKVSSMLIGEYVLIRDLVIVEILKNRFPELFYDLSTKEDLFSKSITDNSGTASAILNVNRIKVSVSKFKHLNEGVESLVIGLLNKSSLGDGAYDPDGSGAPLRLNESYKIYFQCFSQNIVSTSMRSAFKSSDLKQRIEIINELKRANNIVGLINLFEMKFEIQSLENLNKDIFTFVYCSDVYPKLSSRAVDLILKFIDRNENSINALIKHSIYKLIIDVNIAQYERSLFIYNFIKAISRKGDYYSKVFDVSFLEDLKIENYNIFKKYLSESTSIDYNVFSFYYLNIDKVENNRIKLTSEANFKFREFINKHKRDYIALQLRPLYTPRDNYYTFEPFIPQTFEEDQDKPYEKFGEFLKGALENEELSDLKFIGDIFLRFKSSGFDRVELNSSEISQVNKIQEPYSITH